MLRGGALPIKDQAAGWILQQTMEELIHGGTAPELLTWAALTWRRSDQGTGAVRLRQGLTGQVDCDVEVCRREPAALRGNRILFDVVIATGRPLTYVRGS